VASELATAPCLRIFPSTLVAGGVRHGVVSHKSLYSDCHSRLTSESSLSVLDSRFRGNDGSGNDVKERWVHYTRVEDRKQG
jgi:hypothetical protein